MYKAFTKKAVALIERETGLTLTPEEIAKGYVEVRYRRFYDNDYDRVAKIYRYRSEGWVHDRWVVETESMDPFFKNDPYRSTKVQRGFDKPDADFIKALPNLRGLTVDRETTKEW